MIDVVSFIARGILVAVFAIAAFAKLIRRPQVDTTLKEFGLPDAWATVVARGLPFLEFAVAILLVIAPTVRLGAAMALALLTCFTFVIAFNLARGRKPNCSCFGQASAKPISAQTLWRNFFLALCAALVIYKSGDLVVVARTLAAFIDKRVVMDGVLISGIAISFWMIVQLLKQQGRLLVRIDNIEQLYRERLGSLHPLQTEAPNGGLTLGSAAPPFELKSLSGASVKIPDGVSTPNPILLIFLDADCPPCFLLKPRIQAWQERYGSKLKIVMISRGGREENIAKYSDLGAENVILQLDREIANQYRVVGTPSAVVIGIDGEVLSRTALGDVAIDKLVSDMSALEISS